MIQSMFKEYIMDELLDAKRILLNGVEIYSGSNAES